MQTKLRPLRERRKAWVQRLSEVYGILRAGSEKAEQAAAKTLHTVRSAMKMDYFENENLLR